MQGSHFVAALIGAALVGAGVWIGAEVFGGGKNAEEAPRELRLPDEVIVDAEEEPPTLGSEITRVSRRLAVVERRVATLERRLDGQAKAFEPVRRLFEQAKIDGMVSADGTPVAPSAEVPGGGGVVMDEGAESGPRYVSQLGTTLGLTPERTKAMRAAVDGIFEKIKALEKENATVKKDGDTTTITIKPFDGRHLQRDWDDWMARNLTVEERAKLEKKGASNRIFGARLGAFERKVKIKEVSGLIEIGESSALSKDMPTESWEVGPAAVRDLMLEPYAHLLK